MSKEDVELSLIIVFIILLWVAAMLLTKVLTA